MCKQTLLYKVLFGLYFINVQVTSGANILVISTVASHSHALWCNTLAISLAEKGHQVTLLTTDKIKIPIANMTAIVLEGAYEQINDFDVFSDDFMSTSPFLIFELVRVWNSVTCRQMVIGPTFSKFIDAFKGNEKPFDLIIHDSAFCEVFLGLVHRFGYPPLVTVTAYGSPQYLSEAIGNFDNPSIVPQYLLDYQQQMTYIQRVCSTFLYFYSSYYYKNLVLPVQSEMAREIFGETVPDLWNIASNASITLVNHHFSINEPKATVPALIPVGGMHITSSKQLPLNLKKFLNGAKDGAIFFSFGSNIKSSWMSDHKRKMFLEAFAQLPQRVIFKWDEEVPNQKPNMLGSSWLPQNDILGHPNVRVFISHCGLLSTQEAIYHGVPVLGIPIFLDQHTNAQKMVSKGVAIRLDWHSLTKKTLIEAIEELINNPSYKERISAMSKQFRDQPETPMQRAVFWIEYVLRHNGAPHLQSAALKLSHYQILLLDIFIPAVLVILICICIFYYIIKKALQTLYISKSKLKHKTN